MAGGGVGAMPQGVMPQGAVGANPLAGRALPPGVDLGPMSGTPRGSMGGMAPTGGMASMGGAAGIGGIGEMPQGAPVNNPFAGAPMIQGDTFQPQVRSAPMSLAQMLQTAQGFRPQQMQQAQRAPNAMPPPQTQASPPAQVVRSGLFNRRTVQPQAGIAGLPQASQTALARAAAMRGRLR